MGVLSGHFEAAGEATDAILKVVLIAAESFKSVIQLFDFILELNRNLLICKNLVVRLLFFFEQSQLLTYLF